MTFTLMDQFRTEWNPSDLKPRVAIFSCDGKDSSQRLSMDKWLEAPAVVMKEEIGRQEFSWRCGRSPKVSLQTFHLSTLQFYWGGCRVNSHCGRAQSCKDQTPGDAINKVKFARASFSPRVIAFALISWTQTLERRKGEAQRKPLGCTRHHQTPGEKWRPRRSIQVTEHWLVLVHQWGNAPQIPLFSWQPSWLGLEVVVLVDITQHKNANASGTVIPQQLQDNEPLCNGPTSMTWQEVKSTHAHGSPYAVWGLLIESCCCLLFSFFPIKPAIFRTLALYAAPELF